MCTQGRWGLFNSVALPQGGANDCAESDERMFFMRLNDAVTDAVRPQIGLPCIVQVFLCASSIYRSQTMEVVGMVI